jgi:hypothetical protein
LSIKISGTQITLTLPNLFSIFTVSKSSFGEDTMGEELIANEFGPDELMIKRAILAYLDAGKCF